MNSTLELKTRVALASSPQRSLPEGALAKALGRVAKPVRDELLASMSRAGTIVLEPARRGRRVRLTDAGLILGALRVPGRARLSGALVNVLLERLSALETPDSGLRERVLATQAALASGPGGTVPLLALRRALGDVPPRALDDILRLLDREGVLALGRALDLSTLDPETRGAAIEDPVRGALVYVSRSLQGAHP